ncbi:MAG: chemotaxis protein CheW [Terriglobales bacterium]
MRSGADSRAKNGETKGKRAARRAESVILFAVASSTFAIAATAVDEIRNTEGLKPLAHSPLAHAKLARVRHQLVRDGKTYFVVDAAFHFCMLPVPATRVLVLRNSSTAVLVSRIDRMAEINAIYPLPRAFTGDERRWYRGLALMSVSGRGQDEDVVPVVNPESFLGAVEQQALAASVKAGKTKGAALA